jgi:hypothetical protein
MRRFLKPDAKDENWEYDAKKSPYFGVGNWPKFRSENIDKQARQQFSETGETYLVRRFAEIHERSEPDFDLAMPWISDAGENEL